MILSYSSRYLRSESSLASSFLWVIFWLRKQSPCDTLRSEKGHGLTLVTLRWGELSLKQKSKKGFGWLLVKSSASESARTTARRRTLVTTGHWLLTRLVMLTKKIRPCPTTLGSYKEERAAMPMKDSVSFSMASLLSSELSRPSSRSPAGFTT